ncbi:MAG: DUF3078 domain-containing protein [Cruoricaptor ignavus]|nr:DUF3078 domain-containing protein [Cruoricaptor ignavus]
MKKIILFVFVFVSVFGVSQRINPLKKIDSISQEKWRGTLLDIDSLANPVLHKLEVVHDDTIVVSNLVLVPQVFEESIPVTPFNFIKSKTEKRWFFYGQNNLLFNQASFSHWNAGGQNNLGVLGKVNYNLSYKKNKHYLENLLQLGYGLVATEGQSTRKTEDYINLSANYGYELGRNYYLSTGFQFLSQFTAGYNYALTPKPNYEDRVSKFMAPGYLNLGLGISYNPNENFQVIVRPANGKFTFVLDPELQIAGRYGLERNGQAMRAEIGAMANFLYRVKLYKDINLVNQLNFFSNYAYHAERVDINYSGVLNMKFNQFISAIVGLDILYDHDQIQKTQIKQTLGIGFTYNLGAESQPKNTNKKNIKPFIVK